MPIMARRHRPPATGRVYARSRTLAPDAWFALGFPVSPSWSRLPWQKPLARSTTLPSATRYPQPPAIPPAWEASSRPGGCG